MRLRENTIFVKLSTRKDLLDDGTFRIMLDGIEALAGSRFHTVQDLVRPRARVHAVGGPDRLWLSEYESVGFHQRARFRLEGDHDRLHWLEFNAAQHPYSGVFVSMVDLRISSELLADSAQVDGFVRLVRAFIKKTKPISLNAHDTDDHGIQNCDNPGMLKLGYGIEVDSVSLARNPGREWSRGEFRYCANWLTYLGAEMLDKLAPFVDSEAEEPAHEAISGGKLYRLYDSPLSSDADESRNAQEELIQFAGFQRAADKEKWTHGYWQRK